MQTGSRGTASSQEVKPEAGGRRRRGVETSRSSIEVVRSIIAVYEEAKF